MESLYKLATAAVFCVLSHGVFALSPLSDDELAATTGQALLNTGYIAPSGTAGGVSDFGFFKIGLQGEMELNANIKELKLGCGIKNGMDGCDIHIENFSLSGIPDATKTRPDTSAELKNPFFEFAIKNPNSAANREVVGFRLSAESIEAQLGLGASNASSSPLDGLKSFSGYLKAQSVVPDAGKPAQLTGTTNTQKLYYDAGTYKFDGGLNVTLGGADAGNITFESTSGGFWIPAFTGLPFSAPAQFIKGNRVRRLDFNTNPIDIPDIYLGWDNNTGCGFAGNLPCDNENFDFPPRAQYPTGTYPEMGVHDSDQGRTQGGNISVKKTGGEGLADTLIADGAPLKNVHIFGYTYNTQAVATIQQNLNLIHTIQVENSPFYLSLQKEKIKWNASNNDDIAEAGSWWLSFGDTAVNLGKISPQDSVDLCPTPTNCALPQIQAQLIKIFDDSTNWPTSSNVTAAFSPDAIQGAEIRGLPLNKDLQIVLNNLILLEQNAVPNCWGGNSFC